jgi:energy-coupling factor transporter ATP-binding protein EcfA2
MINIEVKGFQSIEDLNLALDGFTAIVGRSNIGKSALVRALKCALTNAEGVNFVRHGLDCARALRGVKTCKCAASVHIVMDGFNLLWEKGDSVNRYLFNGKKYDKPGKGIPEFLLNDGLAPVKVGDAAKSIQIADQFYPLFLLDQSGGVVAETISDVSRLDRVSKATKLVEKDRRDLQGTKKIREADVDKLRIRLCAYEGLDDALHRVGDLEGQYEIIEAKEVKLEVIKGFILKLKELALRIRSLASVESVKVPAIDAVDQLGQKVDQLIKFSDEYSRRAEIVSNLEWVEDLEGRVPDITPVSTLNLKVDQLIKFSDEYSRRAEIVSNLEWVEDLEGRVPDITPVSTLNLKVDQLTKFSVDHARRQTRVDELSWVESLKVPVISGLEELSSKFTLLDLWVAKLRSLKAKFEDMNKMVKAPVPDPTTLQDLQGKLTTLDQYLAKFQSLQGIVGTLENDLAQVEVEEAGLEQEVNALGICPTCVRPMTLDHSHA